MVLEIGIFTAKELITTLNTLKSAPTKMVYKGKVLESQDFDMMERISNQKIKTIEDFTAHGASQSYTIKMMTMT